MVSSLVGRENLRPSEKANLATSMMRSESLAVLSSSTLRTSLQVSASRASRRHAWWKLISQSRTVDA